VLWLTRVPVGARYLTDLLPAFVVVGIAIGLTGPSVQIGALQGVAGSAVGLASGLVETMREIGGAVGIAVVSTVLVARTRDAIQLVGPAGNETAALQGFQAAFTVIAVVAAVGALLAAVAFPRGARGKRAPAGEEPEPVPDPEGTHDRAGAKPALDSWSGAVEARSEGRA
jgi:hypothetical protein